MQSDGYLEAVRTWKKVSEVCVGLPHFRPKDIPRLKGKRWKKTFHINGTGKKKNNNL